MFDENSRYIKGATVEVETAQGVKVLAVKLRRPPYVPGKCNETKGTDRLDMMAHRRYKDGTKFWHVADANSELEANRLVERERNENPLVREETRFIFVPEG